MHVKNVIIINDFNYIQGGASKVAIDTAKILKDKKINVLFFSAVNKIEDNIEGIQYISTNQNESLKEKNILKGMMNGLYNIKAKKELKKILEKFDKKDTIVHVHGWTKALSSSIFDIAFKMKFKVVLTLHDYFTACPNGGYYNYKKNEICEKKPLSWKCIRCNCDSRNYCFKLYRVIRQFIQNKVVKLNQKLKFAIGISDLSVDVLKPTLNANICLKKIYNPIKFDKNEKKVNWNENETYLYVGRISKEKGVDIFCKVITELGLKGIAVGDGSEKERLEKEYPNIEFTGWKSSNEVTNYIRKSKCLIFPSLWYEGAPLTPLESMSYGVPCLVSENCAGREYCRKNNFKDYNELKEKINQINSFKFSESDFEILNKFKIDNYSKDLIEFYNYIIESE